MTKEYAVVVGVVLASFVLLYLNPPKLQNKRYEAEGDSCPNPSWHALILFVFGTALYAFVNTWSCKPNHSRF